jgi:hypothetical protein
MNIKQVCTQYALEVLVATLAILILCAYLGEALAAEPPQPIIGTIGVIPYQQRAARIFYPNATGHTSVTTVGFCCRSHHRR